MWSFHSEITVVDEMETVLAFFMDCIRVRTLFRDSNTGGNSRNKTELGFRIIRIKKKKSPPLIVVFFNQRLS